MIINTREDLDSIKGTNEYDKFVAGLVGSLFIIYKDDEKQAWVAEESNTIIEQFGYTRADFEPIEQPELPVYKKDNSETLQKIAELKQQLSDTDYVTLSDYDKDKPEVLSDRQAWREEIRQLEESL